MSVKSLGARDERAGRRSFLLPALAALALASPLTARAKTVLIIATHPDDEVLMAAGRSRTAFTSGDVVKVVIVTNGDLNGVSVGLTREGESVHSAQLLG